VGLFDFRRGSGVTVLLIVDRLDDAVTPLLTQWTYQVRASFCLSHLPRIGNKFPLGALPPLSPKSGFRRRVVCCVEDIADRLMQLRSLPSLHTVVLLARCM
jgi:hypothetical protein